MGRGGQTGTSTVSRGEPSAAASATRAARKHPERNEDAVLSAPDQGVIAVFDGIGGAAGGDEASRAARDRVRDLLEQLPDQGDLRGRMQWLRDVSEAANSAVSGVRHSMGQGTTSCIAALAEDTALVASIGDSRAYVLRSDGELELLSHDDDTFVNGDDADRRICDEAASEDDLLTLGAQRMFACRNRLAAALGHWDGSLTIDGAAVESGDLLVVSSDGVHDNLTHSEIAEIAAAHRAEGPGAVSAALISAAYERAGTEHFRAKDDDISCCALRVDG